MSAQSMGEMGKIFVQTFSNLFLKTLTEGAVTTEAGAYSSISLPTPKIATFSFGGGSHLGVPCKGAPLGRVGQERGKMLKWLPSSAWIFSAKKFRCFEYRLGAYDF